MSSGVKKFLEWLLHTASVGFCITVIWLWWENKLVLFISAQYAVFAVMMSFIALLLLVIFPFLREKEDEHAENPGRFSAVSTVLSMLVLLTLAPSSLSAEFSTSKPVNAGSTSLTSNDVELDQWKDFTVKEWSAVTDNSSSFDFTDKTTTLEGYVTYLNDDNFYLTRLVVHCCAIDAQPAGLKTHFPGWQDNFKEGDWLSVSGGFEDISGAGQFVFTPEQIKVIEEPEVPYVS